MRLDEKTWDKVKTLSMKMGVPHFHSSPSSDGRLYMVGYFLGNDLVELGRAIGGIGVELPTEELQKIEKRVEGMQAATEIFPRDYALSLLSMIRFLQSLVHDIKEDSPAYQRGVKEGREQAAQEIMAARDEARKAHGLVDGIVGILGGN
jgi:hypothetical protein